MECKNRGRVCTQCYEPFYLLEGECVEQCEDGYFHHEGECEKCLVDKCKECKEPDGACCTECMEGYYLKDNACKRIPCDEGEWWDADEFECHPCKVKNCMVRGQLGKWLRHQLRVCRPVVVVAETLLRQVRLPMAQREQWCFMFRRCSALQSWDSFPQRCVPLLRKLARWHHAIMQKWLFFFGLCRR